MKLPPIGTCAVLRQLDSEVRPSELRLRRRCHVLLAELSNCRVQSRAQLKLHREEYNEREHNFLTAGLRMSLALNYVSRMMPRVYGKNGQMWFDRIEKRVKFALSNEETPAEKNRRIARLQPSPWRSS